MIPAHLQALRRLLFFSRQEAAILVAASVERPEGVSDRAWKMWEEGERPIPADVAARLLGLAAWRSVAIQSAQTQIENSIAQLPADAEAEIALLWYEHMDDWISLAGRDPVHFRPQQSVVAEVLARITKTKLVAFNSRNYSIWLQGRTDSEQLRSRWAAEVSE